MVVFDLNPLVALVSGSRDARIVSAIRESGKSIDIAISAARLVGLGVLGNGFRSWLGFFLGPLLNGLGHLSSPVLVFLRGETIDGATLAPARKLSSSVLRVDGLIIPRVALAAISPSLVTGM